VNPHDVTVLINTGIGGVLLFLYLRQEGRIVALTQELSEVRRAQWQLLVSLFGEEHAHVMTEKPKSGVE
jgi:hypothetical protein